jgi:membrane-associated phospholipid phosphatase
VRNLLIILFVILFSSNAFAQNKSPYDVTPEVEIPVMIGGFATLGMPRLFSSEFGGTHCQLACDPNDINSLDRGVVGKRSNAALITSDVLFLGSMIVPMGFHALDIGLSDPEDGWEGYGKDGLVMAETLIFTLAMNNIMDIAVRRPRPYAYDIDALTEDRLHPNTAFSFPSGHTAAVFAIGTAYSRLYMKRHPESPWIAPIWIGSYAAGAATGITRVYAGEHFWTDIFAGAALGVGSGLFIPWLHERNESSDIKVGVSPMIGPDVKGLTVQIK